jgi:hypothetical protein
MKKLLAIVLLILSFSFNQLAFAQDCFSSGRCRGSWTVYIGAVGLIQCVMTLNI